MGIPKLVSMLQPWASRHQLSNTKEAGENSIFLRQRDETRGENCDATRSLGPTAREAIIDGPALSYHAYGVAVASRSNASNALDAIPSYKEVNAILLECLSVLEGHGFGIVAIFFDGVLPSAKEPTRFERLNSSRKQLEIFRSSNPSLIAEPGKGRRFTPRLPFSYSTVHDKLKALPALPFLVPAAIEALIDSRYQSQTRVVPAEADVFCAKYASLHGGTIFTSDSDLLVYDMAEMTNIILFRDIELIGNTSIQKRYVVEYARAAFVTFYALDDDTFYRSSSSSLGNTRMIVDKTCFNSIMVASIHVHFRLLGKQGSPFEKRSPHLRSSSRNSCRIIFSDRQRLISVDIILQLIPRGCRLVLSGHELTNPLSPLSSSEKYWQELY